MNVEYVNSLAELAYQNAKEHGFFDNEDESAISFAMLHCELSEAIQADRNGEETLRIKRIPKPMRNTNGFMDTIEGILTRKYEYISEPKGVAVELADFVIRLLVFCKHHGLTLLVIDTGAQHYETLPRLVAHLHRDLTFLPNAYGVSATSEYLRQSTACIIYRMIQDVEQFLTQHNVDLWDVVRMKMEYNKTRPRLHGKKY